MNDNDQIDIKGILELLPHRYPFVLVDRIVELELGKRAVGLKNVSINEPFFQGHFPIDPIMPGVLILESMAQVGGILAYLTDRDKFEGDLVYFAGLDNVRFRRKVIPGDQLLIKADVVRRKGKIYKFSARAFVDEQLAAEADLMASFG
ncbi:MAG: 3-hydroxyacyl-ACP dehydratase FabZ [Desulfurivibrionaceae bacterium]|nr:3-hydroxyacyl-ACP dehydratase FabZ [Desulfobulbales bacterium]MDT8335606.1 3-hydroxyacyl-ACP dehydratase FabZ [Desulfurivibrionaceae bacterium]